MSILDFIYFWLDPEQRSGYWETFNGNCLFWGAFLLVIISGLAAFWFYFPYTLKDPTRALPKKWFKIGFIGAIIFFFAAEIIISYFSQLPGLDGYIGENGDIIIFTIVNTLIHFPIAYVLWSCLFKKYSKNAPYIPWVGFKKKKKNKN